jgi:hypothetical protein
VVAAMFTFPSWGLNACKPIQPKAHNFSQNIHEKMRQMKKYTIEIYKKFYLKLKLLSTLKKNILKS